MIGIKDEYSGIQKWEVGSLKNYSNIYISLKNSLHIPQFEITDLSQNACLKSDTKLGCGSRG